MLSSQQDQPDPVTHHAARELIAYANTREQPISPQGLDQRQIEELQAEKRKDLEKIKEKFAKTFSNPQKLAVTIAHEPEQCTTLPILSSTMRDSDIRSFLKVLLPELLLEGSKPRIRQQIEETEVEATTTKIRLNTKLPRRDFPSDHAPVAPMQQVQSENLIGIKPSAVVGFTLPTVSAPMLPDAGKAQSLHAQARGAQPPLASQDQLDPITLQALQEIIGNPKNRAEAFAANCVKHNIQQVNISGIEKNTSYGRDVREEMKKQGYYPMTASGDGYSVLVRSLPLAIREFIGM
jgi:hypothetical protein